jgi:hypothetical protein
MVLAALQVRKEVEVRDPNLGHSHTESGGIVMMPIYGLSQRMAAAQTVVEEEGVHEEDLRDQ